VLNDINNFNTNIKRVRHVKKINVIGLKALYAFILKGWEPKYIKILDKDEF